MKQVIVFVLILMSAVLVQGVYAKDKVTICHATESESNPWVRTVVAPQAIGGHFENNGTPKAGHEDDVLLQGDVPCPTVNPTLTPTTQPTNQPTATPTQEPTPTVDVTPTVTPTVTITPEVTPTVTPAVRVQEQPMPPQPRQDAPSICEHTPSPITHFSVERGVANDGVLHIAWPLVLHTDRVDIVYTDTHPGDWKYAALDLPHTGSYDIGGLVNGTHYWFTMVSKSGCGATWSDLSIDPLP